MSFDSVGSTGGGAAFLYGGFLPTPGVTVSAWMLWGYPKSGRHWCRFQVGVGPHSSTAGAAAVG